MRVEDLLARLEGVTGSTPQWYARCPAHDDHSASLSVALGEGGRILLTCWRGDALEDICRALGVSVADLFDVQEKRRESLGLGAALVKALTPELPDELEVARDALALQNSPGVLERILSLKGWDAATLAALDVGVRGNRLTIPVRDPDGAIVQYLRYWPEAQPKMIATKGHKRTPFYALLDGDGLVWIVEGETDAIGVATTGLSVIGAPGASAKAHAQWLEPVRGRRVIVCFDADEPGRKAAIRWALTARNRGAASVHVVTLEGPEGYDVGEIVRELHGQPGAARARLMMLAAHAEEFEMPVRTVPERTAAPDINGVEPGDTVRTPMSSFRVERLEMLWRDRIPVGRVGIIYGPPGQGKSTLLALMVADVTRMGRRVLIASGDENDPATTLLPRLVAAGADIGLVDLISTRAAKGDTELVFPRDLDAVGRKMVGAAMLLIDPLSAHMGEEVNSWNEQSVRAQVLAPLAFLARASGCAVPYVSHMNKSNYTDALSRISGSGGFGAAARFALLLGSHPDDIGTLPGEQRLVLVHVKANESALQPAMIFRRRIVGVDTGGGEVAPVPVLTLEDDRARISPEAVLAHTDPEEAGAFTQAIEYLRLELATGPKLAKAILADARARGDFSDRTLRKAKAALNVASSKDREGWWWERRQ